MWAVWQYFKNTFILIQYYFIIFLKHMCYSYDRNAKLNAGMEAEEEAFDEKFFYLFASEASK